MRKGGWVLVLLGTAGCNALLGIDDHALGVSDGGDEATVITPPDADAPDVADSAVAPDVDVPETQPGGGDAGVCAAGDLRCNGNTPQKCGGGAWLDQAACGGATPVCSNGLCGSFRTTGGIRSTSPVAASAADGGARLVSGGFEFGARTCGAQGSCVTGGIVP